MKRILKKWDAARIIRLLLGVLIAIYSISTKDYMF
jgi:hypothetical protein